ncbi:hypothetical protein B0T14DRAFT_562239 [Immersiella caudata]|uniref:Phospholipase/carboxylesterase/thioesterase domain-containing protein n=1 Tax=Immersiella caudata TaxID=314043 RepID=A0AA39X3J9_9PEZI|nr:hypothetical protein B0T14DRAFT_562239 [Immersiella caudata]
MPPRVPTPSDFTSLSPLTVSLTFPSPPESTTAILILFHGLGDSETPFSNFAKNLSLPGVLAISVRGVSPLPPALLGLGPGDGPARNFHWGDDLRAGSSGDVLEEDVGFKTATREVLGRLVKGVLVEKLGWETRDILLFGFGQGGSFALGLASLVREGLNVVAGGRVVEVGAEGGKEFKGVVSVGGGLLGSTVPTTAGTGKKEKSRTKALVLCGRESESVDGFAEGVLNEEFESVKVVRWKRPDDGMPGSREEVLPMMEFFAERLRSGW